LLAGKGDWLPKAIKNLRILSLQAKQSNLLANMGIASPPAAARNVIPNRSSKTMFDAPIYICVQNMAFRIVIGITVENLLPQHRKFSTATKMDSWWAAGR
jgi:hypothetical protein